MEQLSYSQESEQIDREVSRLTTQQRENLDAVERGFMHEKRDDGGARWHRFFDAGVRDERGAVWALYNDVWHEGEPDGWQLWYCPPKEETFSRLKIELVVRTDLSESYPEGRGCITVQLEVGDEENRPLGMVQNDRLNILFYQNEGQDERPILRFWNHQSNMEPIPSPSVRLLGGIAVGQQVVAPERPLAA